MRGRFYPRERHRPSLPSTSPQLEEEIESWKGFPSVLRKPDLEQWDTMMSETRELADAVEKSCKPLTTDPFFMALLLVQYRMIRQLKSELKDLGVEIPETETVPTTLDSYQSR